MADITILKVEDYQYDLPVTDFKLKLEILDGEGTGRTLGSGWPLFRAPEGTIINVTVTFGAPINRNRGDFIKLYQDMKSFGKVEFKNITFMTPDGPITQSMYGVAGEIVAKRFVKNNETYWAAFSCEFVAKEAYE